MRKIARTVPAPGEMGTEVIGIPEGTVRTRLHHAKQKLRAALIKEGAR